MASRSTRYKARAALLRAFMDARDAALAAGVSADELATLCQVGNRNLTEAELRRRWQAPPGFLEEQRNAGAGPDWVKVGARILYPLDSVRAFERQRNRGDAPTFLSECRRHGLTWFRQVKAGTTPTGAIRYTKRCLECGRESDAARRLKNS